MVQIDVCSEESIQAAAAYLRSKDVTLYALVNNAGVGGSNPSMMTTNFYGPKMVTDAMVDLVDKKEGRVVNMSSGAASSWVKKQDEKTRRFFSDPNLTWEALEKAITALVAAGQGGYGLSKAGLTALTMVQVSSC